MVKNLSAVEENVHKFYSDTTVVLPNIHSVKAFLNVFNMGLHVTKLSVFI